VESPLALFFNLYLL